MVGLLPLFLAGFMAWNDVPDVTWVKLTQEISFSRAHFKKGENFRVLGAEASSDGSPVIMIDIEAEKCAWPQLSQEMILVRPAATEKGRDGRVGVQLSRKCHLRILVEASDYYQNSFFASIKSSVAGALSQ